MQNWISHRENFKCPCCKKIILRDYVDICAKRTVQGFVLKCPVCEESHMIRSKTYGA